MGETKSGKTFFPLHVNRRNLGPTFLPSSVKPTGVRLRERVIARVGSEVLRECPTPKKETTFRSVICVTVQLRLLSETPF